MKRGWERSKPLIIPDHSTVSSLLQPFLKGKEVLKLEMLSGGLSNSNVKITLVTGECYVLRIYNGEIMKGQVERKVLQLVEDTVPVPEVLYSDFSLSTYEYPVILLSWIHGDQLSEMFDKKEEEKLIQAAHETGRHLAAIHTFQFSSPGFFDEELNVHPLDLSGAESFIHMLEKIITDKPFLQNSGTEMAEDISRLARNHAHLLDHTGNHTSLVHSDFNPLNILIKEATDGIQVTGILDWEFAFSHSPLIDIGNMLRYEDVHQSSFIKPFISSYLKHGGKLPQNWLQQAKLLDMVALCDLANKENCGQVRLLDTQRLIRKTLNEWEVYAGIQAHL
ncbi:aminoglycoside phosphotransferase family protein [Halobacillus rhizosphaerae]|uniref:phosphotransferase family protein n=1 Tax=Halobacillus rhizosphaerae TaxID=3064889 RepID=UPI00398B9CF2